MSCFTKNQQRNGTNCQFEKYVTTSNYFVLNSLDKGHLNSVCTHYVCDKSENARVCAKWQWNALDRCYWIALPASPVVQSSNTVSCVSLSFRTHPCVLAIVPHAALWRHQMETFSALLAIHRSPANSPHKGQWRGALMLSLMWAETNSSENSRYASDWDAMVPIVTSLYWDWAVATHSAWSRFPSMHDSDAMTPWTCTQKRRGRQSDRLGFHWRRWSLSSTSPVNIKSVTLTTFPFQWSAFHINGPLWGEP